MFEINVVLVCILLFFVFFKVVIFVFRLIYIYFDRIIIVLFNSWGRGVSSFCVGGRYIVMVVVVM